MLISLVGGRIIPSFTRNWLAKAGPEVSPPVSEEPFDLATLVVTGLALLTWAIAPDAAMTPWAALVVGVAVALRLSRWRSLRTVCEPLLQILHVGYRWLTPGLLLLGINGLTEIAAGERGLARADRRRDESSTGAALVSAAVEQQATMIVMGAYTHSRLRQSFLGGVTKHLVARAPVPLLMSH